MNLTAAESRQSVLGLGGPCCVDLVIGTIQLVEQCLDEFDLLLGIKTAGAFEKFLIGRKLAADAEVFGCTDNASAEQFLTSWTAFWTASIAC